MPDLWPSFMRAAKNDASSLTVVEVDCFIVAQPFTNALHWHIVWMWPCALLAHVSAF